EGTTALLFAFLLCRVLPRLSPGARCWIWRLAYVRVLLAAVWLSPISLPLLPPKAPVVSSAAMPPRRLPGGHDAAALRTLRRTPAITLEQAARPTPKPVSNPRLILFLLWVAGASGCGVTLIREF